MEEILVQNWNSIVKRGDLVYHLGDFAFTENEQEIKILLGRLNGSKHLIVGNHDRNAVIDSKCWVTARAYKRIKWSKTTIVLFHYPIKSWHGMQKGAYHLHGHCHGNIAQTGKSLDVGVDCWDYRPINFDEVSSILNTRSVDTFDKSIPKCTLDYQI